MDTKSILSLIDKTDKIIETRGGAWETFGALIGTIYISNVSYQVNSRVTLVREGTATVWKVLIDGVKVATHYHDFETILSALKARVKSQKTQLINEVLKVG